MSGFRFKKWNRSVQYIHRDLAFKSEEGGMWWFPLVLLLMAIIRGTASADGGHDASPAAQLAGQTTTNVAFESDRVTITFGPVDLPSEHEGELAASLPKHMFTLPDDMVMTGFHSAVFQKMARPSRGSISITSS
jgi:hypothetical protein